LTALAEEAVAVESTMERAGMLRVAKGSNYDVFEHRDMADTITCALVRLGAMGRLESAVEATRACITFQPKFVMLIGIAGGFREGRWGRRSSRVKLSLGDVLIADRLFDLNTRRISALDDIGVRPKTFELRDLELQIARAVNGSSWKEMIPGELDLQPEVHFGPIISGDILLASDEYPPITRLCETVIRTGPEPIGIEPIGIEMEGSGVALAVDRHSASTGFLMIRGVSDFADRSKKVDEACGRELATYAAASFAIGVIRSREFRSFLKQYGGGGKPPLQRQLQHVG
jgi:nucleoside phosphorylase